VWPPGVAGPRGGDALHFAEHLLDAPKAARAEEHPLSRRPQAVFVEQERGRVDAVAQSGRLGAVSLNAWPRCELHRTQWISVRIMPWLIVAVELRVRAKQRQPAADAGIDVAFAVVVKEAAERALGTVGARNAILIGHRASVCIIGFMMRRRCFCHEKRSIARLNSWLLVPTSASPE
jgi:hypothetical protein